jgi:integrase
MRPRKIPAYRHHRASGLAVVTLSGRDHYLGPHGSSESHREYERLIAEWLAGGRVPLAEASPDLTVEEALASYWGHAAGYYVGPDGQPTSQLDRVARSLTPVRALYAATLARSFGPVALQAVRAWMVRQGWSRKVVNQRVDCVKRAFKWLVAQQLVPASVYEGLRALEGLKKGRTAAPERAPIRPAPEEAIAAALPLLSAPLRDAAELQLLSAARPGEVLALRVCDLDRSTPVWVYRVGAHKHAHRDHARLVLIGPRGQELIRPRLEAALGRGPDSYLFRPVDAMADFRARQRNLRQTKVQPSQEDRSKARPRKQPGERYRVDSYGQAVATACRKAGCAHWHPHQLRHNAATRLVEEFGWDIARIILGHRHLDATRIYGEDQLARAMEAVRKAG